MQLHTFDHEGCFICVFDKEGVVRNVREAVDPEGDLPVDETLMFRFTDFAGLRV